MRLWPPSWMGWPAKDQRAMVALLASWGGTAILTITLLVMTRNLDGYADRLITSLTQAVAAPRPAPAAELQALAVVLRIVVETMKWLLVGTLVTIGLVLIGLGMAINRREMEASFGRWAKIRTTGGDEAAPGPSPEAPPKVQTTTTTELIPAAPQGAPGGDGAPTGAEGEAR